MGNSRLQQVTEWLLWVTACYSKLPIGYSGLQQVTAGHRVVTVGYSRLLQVTEWLQWVTAGAEWLQWVTAGYNRLPCGFTLGYRKLQQVTEW